MERTFAIIKPDSYQKKNEILDFLAKNNYHIIKNFTIVFTKELVNKFYEEHVGKYFFQNLEECMCSGESYCFVIEGDNIINKWRELIGPTNVKQAIEKFPYSLRAKYQKEKKKI
jgi:nucleoside-diphosphate kinase